jgi:hypothetical protein
VTTPQPTPIPGQQLLRKDAAGAFLAAAESYTTQQGLLSAQFKGTTALAGLQQFSTKLAESLQNFNEHLRLIRFPEDAKAAAGDLMAAGSAAEANYRQCSTATTVDACSGFFTEAEKNLAAGRDAANQLRSKLGIPLVS